MNLETLIDITSVALIILLITRALVGTRHTRFSRKAERIFLIPIVPLLIAFGILLAIRIKVAISG